MKVVGIVAEFNPLHKGHEYIMSEARSLKKADVVAVALSGNFVQRGEAAVLDKWKRTEMALSSGADLVIEIPTLFCLGNSAQYANAGVKILEALDPDIEICCGSESGDEELLRLTADIISSKKKEIEDYIKASLKSGISYPAAREKAILDMGRAGGIDDDIMKDISELLNSSNDILALEYMIAADRARVSLIKRMGAKYDSDFDDDAAFQSAQGIRKLLEKDKSSDSLKSIAAYVSDVCLKALAMERLSFPDDWCSYLKFSVMNMSPEEIDDCPSGGEGLGNLLKEAVMKYDNFNDIIMFVKSRRYTYTRISRLCMQALLGISRERYSFANPEYIRVLGANEAGRRLLSEIKRGENQALPVITNINKEAYNLSNNAKEMLGLDVKSQDVYNLVLGRNLYDYSDHRKTPILI